MFDYRCVYDIKYIIITKNQEIIISITLEYRKFKSQL